MALQTEGAISINDIRTELGQAQANSSLRSLSSLAGKSTPDAMSEFYGYSNAVAYTIYGNNGFEGFEDYGQACAEQFDSITVYASSLNEGATIYEDSSLTTKFKGYDLWWYISGKTYNISAYGIINSVRECG